MEPHRLKKKLIATPYNLRESLGCLWRNLVGAKQTNEANVEFLPPASVLNDISPAMRLGFIGDIMDIGSKRLSIGRDTAAFFQDCDAIVGNLEGMITPRRKSRLAQQRHNEEIISSLADAFPAQHTYLIVANNHAADFGVEVYQHTIEKLESWGFHVLGQRERSYLDIAGCARIATGSMWSNQSCDWIAEFRDARTIPQIPAINILCPHWGYELELYPRLHMVQMGRDLLNRFDAIIGHHSHTPQPIARVDCGQKSKFIAYSLGDFCTDIKYRNYRNGLALKTTLGRTHDGSWAIGAVEWRFVQIDPTDSDAVTNTLHTQIESFPGIGNASEGPTSHL